MTSRSSNEEKGASQAPFSISSHAKLNLSLLIYAPRPDGYHPICSVFQEISLHDTLEIELRKKGEFSVSIPGSPINGQPNILDKVFGAFNGTLTHGYHVTIHKKIPIGGGLGGGSTNAAAFLKWLVHFEQRDLSDRRLVKMAVTLGADVPFFLTGGTALVRGIGEKVRSLPTPRKQWFVLINPNQHAGTGDVFRAYDNQMAPLKRPGPTPRRILQGDIGENGFKQVVWKLIPKLAELESLIGTELGLPVYLSGSGATVFIPFDSESEANRVTEWVQARYPGYWVHVTQSCCSKFLV